MTNQITLIEGATPGGIFYRKTTTKTSRDTLVLVMGYGGSLRIWPRSFVEKLASSEEAFLINEIVQHCKTSLNSTVWMPVRRKRASL